MTRSPTRILAATVNEPIWPDYTDDQHGHQRYRAADEAARHLANMDPVRRAELEAMWK